MITYKNGLKEVIEAEAKPIAIQLTSQEYFRLGEEEAKQKFKPKGVFWSTFALTSLPIAGPVAAIYTTPIISLSAVSKSRITAPQPEYLQSRDYVAGYRKQARKKKFSSACSGFGLGLVPYTVFTLSLMVALINH